MARIAAFLALVVVFALATLTFGVTNVSIGVGLIGLSAGVWFLSRCQHSGPLGLLPPLVDAEGHQLAARWYCPQCEAEWPAVFEHDRHPIQRFSGYDEKKAIASAHRANELEAQQRRLAVVRAGLHAERMSGRDLSLIDNVLPLPRARAAGRQPFAKSVAH